MPIYEYQCPAGHAFSRFYKTFSEASKHEDSAECECSAVAVRVVSVPLSAHFYGPPDGFSKPSATRRHSYKLANASGNENSMG